MDNERLNILFLSADPSDAARLRLSQESRDIQERLRMSNERDKFKFYERLSVRVRDISQAILDIEPQIVHFSGHGERTGELCFENQLGKVQTVQPDALANLFKLASDHVNCVLLNACYSEIQAQAIVKHIPFVIGMNKAIGDLAAITFAVGFYKALGAGRSIEKAYEFGCVEMQLENTGEHSTPRLYTKEEELHIASDSNKVQSSKRDNNLASEQGIDYTHLRNLLVAGNWKEADLETCKIMLKISKREEKGWLDNESIHALPCQDLCTIDILWVKYSNGRFGFSVQKQIWQEINESTLVVFGDRVGWRAKGNWLIDYHSDFTFSLDASAGHLPCFATWCNGWPWGEMWQREFGSSGRLVEIFHSTVFNGTSFLVNDWNSKFIENSRRKSISALMSRLEYCNLLLGKNKKQSYFIWVFFLLFSSCLVSLFLIQA